MTESTDPLREIAEQLQDAYDGGDYGMVTMLERAMRLAIEATRLADDGLESVDQYGTEIVPSETDIASRISELLKAEVK